MTKKIKFLPLSKEGTDRVAHNLHEYQVLPETREIFLHRHIHDESGDDGDGCGIDYRSATRFIKNLRFLNGRGRDNILVHMESRGGDWEDGMAIYDAIKASESPVIILAYAHARSMTSIILQAATIRVLMPSALFLIHEGFSGCDDRTRAFLTWAEQDKKDLETMLGVYAGRCKKSKTKVWVGMTKLQVEQAIYAKVREKDDWILSANSAVQHGFADGVLGTKGWETIEKIRCQT